MSRQLLVVCLSAAQLLTACAAANNPTRPVQASDASLLTAEVTSSEPAKPAPVEPEETVTTEPGELTVAYIAGTAVDVRELLDLWLFRDSPGVHDTLGELVVSRFTLAEASRLGMRIPDEQLELAYERGLQALAAEVERVRPGEPVDEYLQRRRGVDPTMYRERLRDQTARALIAERVVRAWLLSNEHLIARAIICQDQKQVEAVEEALASGADFAVLAKEMCLDRNAGGDGLLPPITRSDSAVSRLGFVTPIGEVGGPIEEGGSYLFIRVESRPEPLLGDWLTIGTLVEQSLEERSVEEVEWLQWEEAMFSRYQVDTSPFLRLVGEPIE